MTLDATGYTPKTYDEIVEELEEAFRSTFGNGINLQATSVFGQMIAIFARESALIYEDVKESFDGFAPQTSYGTLLDFIVSILNMTRLEATKGTGTVTMYGTLATVVPEGTIFSVDGNSDARFVTTDDATIAAGTDAVQTITFSDVPDAGQWTLTFDGVETSTLNYDDVAATIESALEALSNLTSVTVAGDYTSGFTITFDGDDGQQEQPILHIGTNTLEFSGDNVSVTVTETTTGELPNVDVAVEAETAGNISAYAGTLTVIETPVTGLDSLINAADIEAGTDVETDAELRLRRLESLSTGSGTVSSIRSALLAIDEVTNAKVYENDTDAVDAEGRPAHSIEAVVLGGVDQEIIDVIGDKKAAGIQTYGSESGTYTDSQGTSHTYYFSRPTEIPIYIDVTLTVDADVFSVDGADAVQQALADYGDETFSIGDDILWFKLFNALDDIDGVLDVDLYIGIAPSPVSQNNITIDSDEIGTFDTANITVAVL